jgi:Fe-S-cluster containining protein
MTVRCLTVHTEYGCRRSGACCSSGWPIPIERDRLSLLETALADGRLQARVRGRALWMRAADTEPDTPAHLESDPRGCVFFDDRGTRQCRIHHSLGHAALPLACRQFPRISVLDPRGASITLSHYCPTAATLLDERRAIAIVDDPPAFPPGAEYVGLDVRASLPPLLRPGMLMDWEAWWEWERRAVALLSQPDRTPDEAIGRLQSAVETTRT